MSNLTSTQIRESRISQMTMQEFLDLLRQKQIDVRAHDGRLKISGPTGALDDSLKAELRSRKAMLLELLSREAKESAGSFSLVPLESAELNAKIPLTAAQRGIWLVDHFNPGNAAYNIPEAFRLDDAMDVQTVQVAVDRLIARHGILRASFHEDDGELSQSIARCVEARVVFTDLSSLPEEQGERRCRELIRDEGQRAFDLTKAPLVRFHLFRLAERSQVLFVNVHHIIADRTSMYVLRGELAELIQAIHDGRDAVLPAVSTHFAEYAVWAAARLESHAMERQLTYWKNKFAGLPKPIELPHSRFRPEKRTSAGAWKTVFVDATTRAALNRIGTEENASPFMTFMALFAVSVALWSQARPQAMQQEAVDFCIGSPMTHRRSGATERMIGLFVNMLAFRCRIQPGMNFRAVLRQVRQTALEAYENSDIPFQRLVTALNPDRRSHRSPFFQVLFGYETYMPPVANDFPMDTGPGTARYDVSLNLAETPNDGLTGAIEFCTDLFEVADIERLAAVGGALAAAIIRNADQDVFGFDLVAERPDGTESPFEARRGREAAAPEEGESRLKTGMFRKVARLFYQG